MENRILKALVVAAVFRVGLLPNPASAGLIPLPTSSTVKITFTVDDYVDGQGNPRNVVTIGPGPSAPFVPFEMAPTVDITSGTSADTGLIWGSVPFPGGYDQEFFLLTLPTYLLQPSTASAEAELTINFTLQYLVDAFGNGAHVTFGFYSFLVNVLAALPGDPDPFAEIDALATYSSSTLGPIGTLGLGGALNYFQDFVGGPFPAVRLDAIFIPALPAGDTMTITGHFTIRGDPANIVASGPVGIHGIPEPSTWVLVSLGLLTVLVRRRRLVPLLTSRQ